MANNPLETNTYAKNDAGTTCEHCGQRVGNLSENIPITEEMIEAGAILFRQILAQYEDQGVGYMSSLSRYCAKEIISAAFQASP